MPNIQSGLSLHWSRRTNITWTGIVGVKFEDFIFYCVMTSPMNRSKGNVRKLENITAAVHQTKIKQQDANKSTQPTDNDSAE